MKIFLALLLIFGGDHLFADKATADLSHQHLADWRKKREEVNKILQHLESKRRRIYKDCDQRIQLIQKHTRSLSSQKKSNLLKKKYQKLNAKIKKRSQLKKLQSDLNLFVTKEKNNINQKIRLMRQRNYLPKFDVKKTSETITRELDLFSVNCQMHTNGIADQMIEGNPKLPSPQKHKLRPSPMDGPKRERVVREGPSLSRRKNAYS
jgi:hypothetical protein